MRLCGLLGRKLPRSRSRSAWRSRRTWLSCRGEGQTGAIFALCALQSFAAGPVRRTVSPGREVGKRRRQCRSNTGIRPGQLPACTGVPLIIMAEHRWRLQRPRVSTALSDRKAVSRPVDDDLVVDVREDHVVCGRRLHVIRRPNPIRHRRVNRHRQHEGLRRGWWRQPLDELRRGRRQEACGNGRRQRKVVARVAEKDHQLPDVDQFFGWRWRDVVVHDTEVDGGF